MKILGRIAFASWLLGVGVIIYAAIAGPGPYAASIFVLWAPAAVWQWLRWEIGLVNVIRDEWYTPIENPQTFADAVNNLNGAVGNLTRSIAGRKGPDE